MLMQYRTAWKLLINNDNQYLLMIYQQQNNITRVEQ